MKPVFNPRNTSFSTVFSTTVLLLAASVSSAPVFAGAPPPPSSRVDTDTNDIGGGLRSYEYTVVNTSDSFGIPEGAQAFALPVFEGTPVIVDWELPWFDDGDIDTLTIDTPVGWLWGIEQVGMANPEHGWGGIADWQTAGDPWNYFLNGFGPDGATPIDNGLTNAQADAFLNVQEVLHWYIDPQFWDASGCNGTVPANGVQGCSWGWEIDGEEDPITTFGIFPENSQGGFGFDAMAPTDISAPYQASWFDLPVETGDPPFPGAGNLGPSIGQTSALQPTVPEPGVLALLAAGFAGLGWGGRRRAKKK
ncbi:MAG: PEP-CTERM sorting domain-containing protein [Gammaproteobacteria bacterium]|nr:PEP-CTERM sorting domain-containing protein [Gammaproteobacteria bacterium]